MIIYLFILNNLNLKDMLNYNVIIVKIYLVNLLLWVNKLVYINYKLHHKLYNFI